MSAVAVCPGCGRPMVELAIATVMRRGEITQREEIERRSGRC